jgi:hypothetical protein
LGIIDRYIQYPEGEYPDNLKKDKTLFGRFDKSALFVPTGGQKLSAVGRSDYSEADIIEQNRTALARDKARERKTGKKKPKQSDLRNIFDNNAISLARAIDRSGGLDTLKALSQRDIDNLNANWTFTHKDSKKN